jgi:hypothetical protein
MQEIYGETWAQHTDFHLDDQQAVEADANRECIGASKHLGQGDRHARRVLDAEEDGSTSAGRWCSSYRLNFCRWRARPRRVLFFAVVVPGRVERG